MDTLKSLAAQSPLHPITALALAIVAPIVYFAYTVILQPILFKPPLYDLPGPPRSSIIMGNFEEILDAEPGRQHMLWFKKYSSDVIRYTMMWGHERVALTDPAALNYILLTHPYDFPKPPEARGSLSRILGKGLLFAEGDDHKRQKKIMTPAFSPSHIKAITPIFFEQAYKLRDVWHELVRTSTIEPLVFSSEEAEAAYKTSKAPDDEEAVLEVSRWYARVTLDIIGLTGFGYDFNALSGEKNKLGEAFSGMLAASTTKASIGMIILMTTLNRLILRIPLLQRLPIKRITAVREGFQMMEEECVKIVQTKKQEILDGEVSTAGGGKDLMSLLLKSNMATSDPKLQMTDAELQGQITTIMLAGHETTSTALIWTTWTLARHPAVQDRLRKEIQAARQKAKDDGRDELSYDELSSLEYLDAVTREILRFEPPAPGTVRQSTKDAMIPLSVPVVTKSGKTITSFFMPKGTVVFMSVTACNFKEEVFGSDAAEFRPERWLDGKVGEKIQGVGVWSQLLTFLGGARACIGYRFSLMELKAILTVLVGDFVFETRDADNGPQIERRSTLVSRPVVIGEEKYGFRMPLRIRAVDKEAL